MSKRNLDEVRSEIGSVEKQIKEFEGKDALTVDEAETLTGLVGTLERAKADEITLKAESRYRAIKQKEEEINRPLPVYGKAPQHQDEHRLGKAFVAWVNRSQDEADIEKVRNAGFSMGSNFIKVPFDPKKINFKNRALSTSGSPGTGIEYVSYKHYSEQVFDHLTYENPLLGFLRVESVPDGQERDYYTVDDTGMISVDTVGVSGSTELNPNLPDTDLISGRVELRLKTITSGYQKITLEMMQDAPFALEGRIAQANNRSHARKMDRDVVLGGGTAVAGLTSLCTALPDVAAWNMDEIEKLWDSVPDYYRAESIFLSNAVTKSAVRRALKDANGRTYFDRSMVGNQTFDTILGNPWVVSANVPDNVVLFFNPTQYVLPVVNTQVFQRFDEKFFAQTAWCGIARFGGGRVGSTSAFKKVTLD